MRVRNPGSKRPFSSASIRPRPSSFASRPATVSRSAPTSRSCTRPSIAHAGVSPSINVKRPSYEPSLILNVVGVNVSWVPSTPKGALSCCRRSGSTVSAGARSIPLPLSREVARSILTLTEAAAGSSTRSTAGREAARSPNNAGKSASRIAGAEKSSRTDCGSVSASPPIAAPPTRPVSDARRRSPQAHQQIHAHVVDPRSLAQGAVGATSKMRSRSAGDAHSIDSDTATGAASWRRKHSRSPPSAACVAEDRDGEPVEAHFRHVDRSLEE